jgi:hypothetical protein
VHVVDVPSIAPLSNAPADDDHRAPFFLLKQVNGYLQRARAQSVDVRSGTWVFCASSSGQQDAITLDAITSALNALQDLISGYGSAEPLAMCMFFGWFEFFARGCYPITLLALAEASNATTCILAAYFLTDHYFYGFNTEGRSSQTVSP